MVRRSTRWRPPPPRILSLPTSVRVFECYAVQGKAHHHRPLLGEVSELLLVNEQRETCWVRNAGGYGSAYACTEIPPGDWRVLGWRPFDRSLRHGEFDRVDPDLADLHELQCLNPAPPISVSTPGMTPSLAGAQASGSCNDVSARTS